MAPLTVDSISSLPDEILCRILSLLSTKESVATSVLSKRWTHLCHHVPNLQFSDITVNTLPSILLFNQFVYSLLLSRDSAAGSNFVNTFRLHIRYDTFYFAYNFGFPNITKWINFVVQPKFTLKNLSLHFNGFSVEDLDQMNPPKLPLSIFTCKTLVSLSLRWFKADGYSFSSKGCQLPSLKILHLELLFFSDFPDFLLLLAGSPLLEDLLVSQLYFLGVVEDAVEDDSDSQDFKSLCLPNLTRADLAQCGCSWFRINALSSCVSLCMQTCSFYIEDDVVSKMKQFPVFHNLTHLKLHNNWELALKVLHLCPKLQNLQLYQDSLEAILNGENNQENTTEPEFVPQCISLYLRTCTIRNFLGLQGELKLAKYILKNGKNLQTMSIWGIWELPEIERELSACPKASATCELSIIYNRA
ncbi:FBD-associated F-box protein At5g56370-like [Vicia villosa]|uniref:FBD-associated F-box protein At5g56370-like n=1 Tax=Vicia villosa TaxID=3911 RepID=UPI00273C7480|nr:FBD-associated F-box protein At5g56370-like [Vicia villosa]